MSSARACFDVSRSQIQLGFNMYGEKPSSRLENFLENAVGRSLLWPYRSMSLANHASSINITQQQVAITVPTTRCFCGILSFYRPLARVVSTIGSSIRLCHWMHAWYLTATVKSSHGVVSDNNHRES